MNQEIMKAIINCVVDNSNKEFEFDFTALHEISENPHVGYDTATAIQDKLREELEDYICAGCIEEMQGSQNDERELADSILELTKDTESLDVITVTVNHEKDEWNQEQWQKHIFIGKQT